MLSLFKPTFDVFDWFKTEPVIDTKKFLSGLEHTKTEESGETDDYTWKSETWKSKDGTATYSRKVYTSKPAKRERNIKAEIDAAVERMDFEEAARLRDEMNGKTKETKKEA